MSHYLLVNFLIYIFVNAFTPGPGNILALDTATNYRWKKGKPLATSRLEEEETMGVRFIFKRFFITVCKCKNLLLWNYCTDRLCCKSKYHDAGAFRSGAFYRNSRKLLQR